MLFLKYLFSKDKHDASIEYNISIQFIHFSSNHDETNFIFSVYTLSIFYLSFQTHILSYRKRWKLLTWARTFISNLIPDSIIEFSVRKQFFKKFKNDIICNDEIEIDGILWNKKKWFQNYFSISELFCTIDLLIQFKFLNNFHSL